MFAFLRWVSDTNIMEWLKHFTIQDDGHSILVNDWLQGKRYGTDGDKLIYEENYLNDKQHGTQYWWHDNGRLSNELNYANDKPHGMQRHWHRNGQLEDEEYYDNGLKHGIYRSWHMNGELNDERKYINDVRHPFVV